MPKENQNQEPKTKEEVDKDKDGGDKDTTETDKLKSFAYGLTNDILVSLLFGIVLMGSMALYMCKVAQARILPDDADLAPFTNKIRVVDPVTIPLFVVHEYGLKGLGWMLFQDPTATSAKTATFDHERYMGEQFGGVLGRLYEYKQTGGNYWLYFASILQETIALANNTSNRMLGAVGTYLPDWLTMILGGMSMPMWPMLVGGFNFWTTLWFHLKDLPHLFRERTSNGQWEDDKSVHYMRPMKWVWAILLFWVCLIPFCLVWGLATLYNLVAPFFVRYKTQDKTQDKTRASADPESFAHFLADVFAYKRPFLLSWIAYFTMSRSSKTLGPLATGGIFLGILLAAATGVFAQTVAAPSAPPKKYVWPKARAGREISQEAIRKLRARMAQW